VMVITEQMTSSSDHADIARPPVVRVGSVDNSDKTKNRGIQRGMPALPQAIDMVRREAGSSSEIIVRDMMDARDFGRATALGVRSVPAVAIDGKLVSSGGGVNIQTLRDAELVRALH
jgi:glutaredoxin 3